MTDFQDYVESNSDPVDFGMRKALQRFSRYRGYRDGGRDGVETTSVVTLAVETAIGIIQADPPDESLVGPVTEFTVEAVTFAALTREAVGDPPLDRKMIKVIKSVVELLFNDWGRL